MYRNMIRKVLEFENKIFVKNGVNSVLSECRVGRNQEKS
jgi:hypothetical protein